MTGQAKALRITGIVLHVLVAALMIFAGSGKAFGFAPAEVLEGLAKINLKDKTALIGWGEIIAAVVMILPWTVSLGTLAVSGFWGGVIVAHMVQNDSYAIGVVFMLMTWAGAYLRVPALLPAKPTSPAAPE